MIVTLAPWQRPLYCMRIVCRNGLVVRLFDYAHDQVISGNLFKSDAGYQFTGVDKGSSFTPGAIDFSSIMGLSPDITVANIQAGIFDHATVFIFKTDWAAPVEDHQKVFKGTFGKVTIRNDLTYKTEVMNLVDVLNTTIGETYSAGCSLKFGGQEWDGCQVDAVALRQTGTITSVTSNYIFADTSRTEVDDWFGYGEIWFLDGPNEGIAAQHVKDYFETGGVFHTSEPFPYLPEVGDSYIVETGCRKRLEDCIKYNNTARRRAFNPPGEKYLRSTGGT